MGKTKTEFKWYTIPQYRKEEQYLSEMHKKGWKLTRVSWPGFYHFEQCEPENVTYRLDYNQEGIENKSEYVQMFADCGWEYLFDFVGYSYFRKASDEAEMNEEIFCDDDSRLDMMRRVFKGRIVPLIVIFFCCILPQLFINMNGFGGGNGNIVQHVLAYLLLALGIIYIVLFGIFAMQFYQYEKNFASDENIKTKYVCIFIGLIIALMAMIGIVCWANHSRYKVTDTESGFILDAEALNEDIVKEYELKPGDSIYVNHDGDGGEMYISIGKDPQNLIFYGNTFDEFGEFAVSIEESGIYQIKCVGKRAKGKLEVEIK